MNTFQLRVDDRHVLESTDGERLHIKTTDGSRVGVEPHQADSDTAWGTSLRSIEAVLSHYGIEVPEPLDIRPALSLLTDRLIGIEQQAEKEPERPFTASFCNGSVKVQWNPGTDGIRGIWTVVWPNFQKRLPTDPKTISKDFYCRSLTVPFFDLVEQSFTSLHVSLGYDFVNEAMYRLVDAMTSDGQITFPKENECLN